jgi:hypothetical protein
MVKIKQGNIFGRIGTGLGRGLAEQIPKEVERHRLSSGLRELGEKKNLTPFQQFSELASIPGAVDRPQLIQSGAELLRQQGISQELRNKAARESQPKQNPYFQNQTQQAQPGQAQNAPSITTRAPIEATLENYIPKSFEQKQQRAGELLQESPALYANDPQKAFAAAEAEDQSNQNINAALQDRRKNEQNVQDRIETGLNKQLATLGAQVPGNVYSRIEDKAINAVRPINQGGEGLTEQQAKKKYGDELDKVSREYKALETAGNWSMMARSPAENKRTLRSIREGFKDRDDLENLADSYTSKNGLSPGKAYYLAFPPFENKELSNVIAKMPDLKESTVKKGFAVRESDPEVSRINTLISAPKLATAMGKEGSPLAVAEELQAKGYDPIAWLDYLKGNRQVLDLSERQGREIDKPRNFAPTLNDNWLFLFSGLDPLVEQ